MAELMSYLKINGETYEVADEAARAAVGNFPITKIVSESADTAPVLRSLDSGSYVLQGKFRAYTGATGVLGFSSALMVNVIKSTSKSSVQIFYPVNNCVQFLEITDEAMTKTFVYLNQVQEHIGTMNDLTTEDKTSLVAAINELVAMVSSMSGDTGGGITEETDPTVPAWAKEPNKPTYTAEDVGAAEKDHNHDDDYAAKSHDHAGVYQPAGSYADEDHNHDGVYVKQTELNSAVNTALQTAKESGEFDGEDGTDGYTPVAGVDYPTDAQFDEKIATALANRNQLEPIVADSKEWLDANGDPTKVYIVPNADGQGGKVYAYAEKTIATEPETTVDVNVLDTVGVTTGVRLSSSSGSTSASANALATGFIPCDDDDIITVTGWRGYTGTSMYIIAYDSSQTKLAYKLIAAAEESGFTFYPQSNTWATYTADDDTFVTDTLTSVLGVTGIAYIRLSAAASVADTMEIYVNKGSGSSSGEPSVEVVPDWYAFADFIPTEDARIDELNRAVGVLDAENEALDRRVTAIEENGVTSGGATAISRSQALTKIRNWDKPIYERLIPFLLDEDLTVDTTYPKFYADASDSDGALRRVNVQKVYDEYNALCTAHPDFVRDITDVEHGLLGATETTFGGLCSDGIQYVRVYEFCEREGRHSNTTVADNWSETKPTFVIVTGIHWEYNGVYSMLYALKEITENPELRDMRRNCRFVVIPMSNPYCFTTYNGSGGGHYNANGVEIHNNFEVDFNNAIDSTHGTAPLTEVETRYINNALRKYRDTAVCLLSCHSNATNGANFIWGSTATKFMCNVTMRLVDMMSNAWDVKYDGTDGNYNYRELIDTNKGNGANPQDDGDYRCGFASLSTSSGTEAKQATLYGVQGINVEVYEYFYPFDPNGTNKLLAYSRGAETYINLLRLLAATYDHNDRDKYAPTPAYEIEG